MSRSSTLLLAAIVPAVLGGLIGAFVVHRLDDNQAPPPVGDAAMQTRLDELRRTVQELAQRSQSAPAATMTAKTLERVTPPQPDAELLRRIATIEQQLQSLRSAAVGETAPGRNPTTAAIDKSEPAPPKPTTADHQSKILATGATDPERLAAWGELRNVENGWNDAIVATMVGIGLGHQDPILRADVWRQADSRNKHPAIGQALLQALSSDGEAKVREEAAETLAEYLHLPGVRAALETAANGDVSLNVRRQAQQSLANSER